MGLLLNGQWADQWYDTQSSGGEFRRQDSRFRNWITADGAAGPTGEGGFKAEAGRYHLYVSLACPWAHRTMIRFDAVYYGHFKTNRQHIVDFPAISHYLRELYQHPGVAQTVNFHHIKQHYYGSHVTINPTQVVPVGPDQDFTLSHNRDRFYRKQQPLTAGGSG